MNLLKPVAARLAIVNPIGAVPFFLAFTQGMGEARRQRTRNVAAFSAFCVVAVVRLTVPLPTGPAPISTRVISAEKSRHAWQQAVLVGYGVVIGLATWAAMAVRLVADGLVKLFPILASPSLR